MNDAPLLLDAKALADTLATSPSTIWRWDAAGKLPRPLRLTGGTTRWRRADVEAWINAGCPNRTAFESITNNSSGRPPAK